MTWIRLDDLFSEHPKIAALSDRAFRAHVRGICYSGRLLTDGHIGRNVAKEWGRGAVAELVQRGVWRETAGGYEIHDYLDWNPRRAEVQALRDSKRIAGAKGSATRWGDSKRIAEGEDKDMDSNPSSSFVEFWEAYPRRVGKRAAEAAFENAVGRAKPAEIIAGAARFAADPNRVDTFTPHPTTWLNQDRWNDAPLPSRNGPRKPSRFAAQAERLGVSFESSSEADSVRRGLPGAPA